MRKPRMQGIVGRSYDPDASRWFELVRQYGPAIDPAITKLEPHAVWLSAEYLKQAREEVGLSQRTLAMAAGISSGVIANWEADAKNAGWVNVVRLYAVLAERGSERARKAMLGITETDKEISLAMLGQVERDLQLIKARLQKCDAEIQRLKGRAAKG